MRVRRPAIRTFVTWSLAGFALALVLLLTPVAYIELACRGDAESQAYRPVIADPSFQRREANTYLTYPEWHIVFAYDGLAEVLKAGDEYSFDYLPSVSRFWSSTCSLMRVADEHGGADFGTRSMIHTIGVSFTIEMVMKGAYEETIGRAAAWWRGPRKTPQDVVVAGMASDYAAFLRQTPWYRYPFRRQANALWAAPLDGRLRGWERRLAVGLEFQAKAVYGRVIERAAAAAPAQLSIRSIVSGLDPMILASIPDVTVVGVHGRGVEIETPRYDLFTRILADIARRRGTIQEIAGNDDVMVTITVPQDSDARVQHAVVLMRMKRDGFPSDRLLVNVKVPDLAPLLNALPLGDPGIEHVFDY
jgi:hypothetical protein